MNKDFFSCKMPRVTTSNKLVLEEYQFKCHSLKNDLMKMLLVRQNLIALNEKNESMSKRLLNMKAEYELYKSHLCKTLFDQKVAADKQKILSKKKLDEFLNSKKRTKEYYQRSPVWSELEELIKKNTSLEEACRKQADLLELMKQQHNELFNLIKNKFQRKVCEFCHTAVHNGLLEFQCQENNI